MKAFALAALLLMQGPGAPSLRIGVVTGQIRSVDGVPAAGVRVGALAALDSNVQGTGGAMLISLGETDNAGRYRLEDVPPGRYYITAGALAFPTYFPGAKTQTGARTITVIAGSTVADVDFALSRPLAVQVRGLVTGIPADRPPGLINVRLVPAGGPERTIETPLKPDGTFEFLQVSPGAYTVRLLLPMQARVIPINVEDKDVSGIEIAMPPVPVGRKVSGTVTGQTPWPKSIHLTGRNDGGFETTIAADGTFEFPSVEPGGYSVSLPFFNSAPVELPFIAVGATNLSGIEIANPAQREILGRIVVPDGSSLQEFSQIFLKVNPGLGTRVGADGRFTLTLPLREYQVSLNYLPLGYFVRSIAYGSVDLLRAPLKVDGPASAEILITLGATPPPEVRSGVKVSGRVTNPPTIGQRGNSMVLFRMETDGQTFLAGISPDGSFQFPAVPPGQYGVGLVQDRSITGMTSTTVSVADQEVSGLLLNLSLRVWPVP